MRRRDFIFLFGGAAAWPLVVRGQPAMPVVGYLGAENPERFGVRLTSFRQGLNETGYEEGRNVTVEYRWANGHYDKLPALAAAQGYGDCRTGQWRCCAGGKGCNDNNSNSF